MSDPVKAAEAIIQRVWNDPTAGVTAADAAVLEAVPERTLMMEKLLAVHYNQTGQVAKALKTAQAVFAAEPEPENAKNVALLLRALKRLDEAVAFCHEHEARFRPIEWNDALCMIQSERGDKAAATRHGTRSLELKDAACEPAPPLATESSGPASRRAIPHGSAVGPGAGRAR